jgi:hypothetical protein
MTVIFGTRSAAMNARRQFRLEAALTAVLLVITVGGAPQTRAETRTDMPSEHNADAKAPDTVEIIAGRVGKVGSWEVGVGSVEGNGSAKKAILSTWTYSTGVPAEFNMPATEHALIPLGDGLHQILWILPETQTHRGRVGISSVPRRQQSSVPEHVSVYIVADGRLRVNGPDIDGATDIRVTAWNTDQSPASVEIKWKPSAYAEKDTDPKKIQRAHLKVGSSLNIDGQVLTVRAIEPKTAEHPAWVRLEMAKTR